MDIMFGNVEITNLFILSEVNKLLSNHEQGVTIDFLLIDGQLGQL